MMPQWLAVTCMVTTWALGVILGCRIGWKRGNALTPKDYELRDLVQQRDKMMRERDEANAAANKIAVYGMQMEAEVVRLRNLMPYLRHSGKLN